jgi:hypothetical protein
MKARADFFHRGRTRPRLRVQRRHRRAGTPEALIRFHYDQWVQTEDVMPRGDKSKYTDKQKRKAEHIEESYESRGVSNGVAERRVRASINKESGGGKKSGSGRGRPETHVSSCRGRKLGGQAAASRPAAAKSRSARKAAATRRRHAAG